MSHELVQKRYVYSIFPTGGGVEDTNTDGGPVDLNATGDKFGFAPACPIDIYRFGLISAVALDPDAGGFVLALDLRPTAGSDTNRVEKDTLTRADAQTVAAGKVVYRDVIIPVAETTGNDGSKVNVGPSGPLHVRPGEEVILEVTNALGAAGTARLFIEYAEQGFALTSTVTAADGVNVIKDSTGQ